MNNTPLYTSFHTEERENVTLKFTALAVLTSTKLTNY